MMLRKGYSILPGFGLTLGYSTFYLSLIVLLPLAVLFAGVFRMSWAEFLGAVAEPRVVASYKLTLLASLAAAVVKRGLRIPGGLVPVALFRLPRAQPLYRARWDRPSRCHGRIGHRDHLGLCRRNGCWRSAVRGRHRCGLHAAGHCGGAGLHRLPFVVRMGGAGGWWIGT